MAPTVLIEDGFRFFFFSREESRMHVHVHHSGGEAKFWLEPQIELAQNFGLTDKQLREAERIIRSHESDIRSAWQQHFEA
jgi:hypothetical protein